MTEASLGLSTLSTSCSPLGGGVFNGSFSSATDDDWLVFAANSGDLLTLTGNSVGFFTNGVLLQDTGDGNFQVGDAVNVLNFNNNNVGQGSPLQILTSNTAWQLPPPYMSSSDRTSYRTLPRTPDRRRKPKSRPWEISTGFRLC